MNIQKNSFLSIEQLQDQYLKQAKPAAGRTTNDGYSFQDILTQKTAETEGELRFSKHASNRLTARNITLTDNQMERLSEGAQRAGAKGIKESLVLVDSLAFIVNVPNKMVVTAMNQSETDENVFTNIDGAVIM